MNKLSAVILDLGNVVIELDFDRLFNCLGLGKQSNHKLHRQGWDKWEVYDAFERGKISEESFLDSLQKITCQKYRDDFFQTDWNLVFRGAVPGIESLLENVSAQVPLYCLTNSNAPHIRYCRFQYPCLRFFRYVFTSFELGLRKPEPLIFQRVSDAVGLDPEHILFVDDREENVTAARESGFQAETCLNSARHLAQIIHHHLPFLEFPHDNLQSRNIK